MAINAGAPRPLTDAEMKLFFTQVKVYERSRRAEEEERRASAIRSAIDTKIPTVVDGKVVEV